MKGLKPGDEVIVRPDSPTRLFGQRVVVDEILVDAGNGEVRLGVTGMLDRKPLRDYLRTAWVYASDSEDMHEKCYACNARVMGESADFWKKSANARTLLNDILHHIRYGKPSFAIGDEELYKLAGDMVAKAQCGRG